MKAAVLFKTGSKLQLIEHIKIPLLEKGQVLIKMLYSGLCHSQLMEISGGRGEDKYLPHLLGHEGVGVVEETGNGVNKVNVGDTVVIGWIKGKGLDAPGGKYQHDGYLINSGSATTLSEKTIVAENRVVKLPDSFPVRLAMLLGCALPTGLGLVFNELKPKKSKTIAVLGLGGVGMSALLACKLYKPSMLIAIDIEEHKLELAKELGATHCINASKVDVIQTIQALTKGGVDYSIEAGGTAKSIEQAFASIKDGGGECIFASHPADGEKIKLEPHAFHRGKSIRGSWGGKSFPDEDILKFVDLYKQGKLNLECLISNEYKLDDINCAIDDLKKRKIVRALISIN